MEYVPDNAPLVALAFLFTGFAASVGVVLLAVAVATRRREWARKIFVALVVLALLYGGTLLAASWMSSEKTLRTGEKKYFCEIDCHLAYSVTSVQSAKALGSGNSLATAVGTFYVVTLQTWFDEKTISANRGNGLLYPNPRMARVLDKQGRSYAVSLEGMKAVDAPAAKMVPLTQPLRPGDAYETTLVFDLPPDAQSPQLWLTDPDPVNRVLIGHENSFFHKKVYFQLEAGGQGAVSRE